jgi:hypothetical protein
MMEAGQILDSGAKVFMETFTYDDFPELKAQKLRIMKKMEAQRDDQRRISQAKISHERNLTELRSTRRAAAQQKRIIGDLESQVLKKDKSVGKPLS